jgi:TatD DNase family protein
MLVDSHCHLDFPDFADDLDGIVARAESAGIGRIVTISTRVRRFGSLLEIAGRFPNVYCSVGTHPHHADEEDGIPADELIELTNHPKVVALGEAGLDNFYDNGSPQAQERGFRAHIAAARATGLPLVIHTRDADEACGNILEDEMAKGPFRAVLHCYTGGRDLAMKAISLGLSISFTGILTFKKSQALRDLAAELPADRIMVETDSPYLAPGKFRGKRNEPSYVVEVDKVLAETRGVSLERFRVRPPRISLGCSAKCRLRKRWHDADIDRARLRILGRRSASGTWLGRLRSQQSEEPPPPLLAAGRTAIRQRHHPNRDRYLA